MNVGDGVKSIRSIRDRNRRLHCVSCVCGLKDKKQTETASFGLRRLCIDFSALDFWMVSVFVFDNDAV